ncbi:MAG: sugar phosphate isomerase/epimerase [Candidatus Devosia euplotis]|nr:sugar phosphate isomerase/epimerase [Candidatus Devosia euplotis]
MIAVSGTYNMIHPDPALRAVGLERLDVIAGACVAMGTDLITLCTGAWDCNDQWRYHPDSGSVEAWCDLLAEMAKAVAIAERHEVRLRIEPELANVVDSAPRARQLIDTLASPVLRVVLDPANLFEKVSLGEQREVVSRAIDLLADRIVMGRANGRMVDGGFAVAGAGVLDYRHYIACLRANGSDGDLVAHGLDASDAKAVVSFLLGLLR